LNGYLAPAIADFCRSNAYINVDMSLSDRVIDLVDEGFDVAVRIGRLHDSSLIAKKIAPSRELICASPAYLRSHGYPRHPTDLKHHNCLTYRYASNPNLWRFSKGDKEISVKVSGNLSSNNGAALTSAAVAGLGIIKQPTFNISAMIHRGELVELLDNFTTHDLVIYAVHPPGRPVPLKVKKFVDFLSRRFIGRPAWDSKAGPSKA
jgi:DNA-binding transcriptional LysR family regulator